MIGSMDTLLTAWKQYFSSQLSAPILNRFSSEEKEGLSRPPGELNPC